MFVCLILYFLDSDYGFVCVCVIGNMSVIRCVLFLEFLSLLFIVFLLLLFAMIIYFFMCFFCVFLCLCFYDYFHYFSLFIWMIICFSCISDCVYFSTTINGYDYQYGYVWDYLFASFWCKSTVLHVIVLVFLIVCDFFIILKILIW